MFDIEFMPDAWEHLQAFSARDRKRVLAAIKTQLRYESYVPTRNRKPLRADTLAGWELRVDPFRVFYDIENNSMKIVYVIAIGVKQRNQVFIGGKRFELWHRQSI